MVMEQSLVPLQGGYFGLHTPREGGRSGVVVRSQGGGWGEGKVNYQRRSEEAKQRRSEGTHGLMGSSQVRRVPHPGV
eukprot:753471-Hanusia_phi.AAC.5